MEIYVEEVVVDPGGVQTMQARQQFILDRYIRYSVLDNIFEYHL